MILVLIITNLTPISIFCKPSKILKYSLHCTYIFTAKVPIVMPREQEHNRRIEELARTRTPTYTKIVYPIFISNCNIQEIRLRKLHSCKLKLIKFCRPMNLQKFKFDCFSECFTLTFFFNDNS